MTAAKSIFPIRRYPDESPHYVNSPREYHEAFQKVRPDGATWYAYSVTILSRNRVEFVAFDMRDNCRGGIGDEIWRVQAKVPKSLTRRDVDRAIIDLAMQRRHAELAAAEAEIINGYADEIRAELDA